MKTIKTIILVLALCVMNQFANAQKHPAGCQPCGGNKVKMNDGNVTCVHNWCDSKCVSVNQVQNYLNQGWVLGNCFYCQCFYRLSGDADIHQASSLNIYPNPVSNSTTISFSISQSQKVSLKIFDVRGRLVSTLADGIFEAGENELMWSAADVNAGIYFLQFQSAENLQTEKLIVTK